MKINNCKELWYEWLGGTTGDKAADSIGEETEERALALLEKWVCKGTECGCVFGQFYSDWKKADPEGIYVGGYAEGSDSELPLHTLKWGFTIEEFTAALDEADKEGVEAWHEANDEDLERVVDEV